MITIIKTKDFELLTKLNEEIQSFHHHLLPNIFKPYNKEAILNFFKTTLNNENALACLAKQDEQICGYALLFKMNMADNPFQYPRSFVLIDQIVVLEKHQKHGVGKLLLERAFLFAKENNINTVELNHWTLNDRARKFFSRNKFEYYNEKMWRAVE